MKPVAESGEALSVAIPDHLVQLIADDADADVRSVWKRLAGGTLRPKTQKRIDAAIARHLPARSATDAGR